MSSGLLPESLSDAVNPGSLTTDDGEVDEVGEDVVGESGHVDSALLLPPGTSNGGSLGRFLE